MTTLEAMGVSCCGIMELANVQLTYEKGGCEKILADLKSVVPYARRAYLIFSVTLPDGVKSKDLRAGGALADYIEQEKLGTTVAAPAKRNPNSGNVIKAWIWTLSRTGLDAYYTRKEKKSCSKPTI